MRPKKAPAMCPGGFGRVIPSSIFDGVILPFYFLQRPSRVEKRVAPCDWDTAAGGIIPGGCGLLTQS